MSNIKPSNPRAALVSKVIAGTKKHYPNPNQPMKVGGADMTVQEVTDVMQAYVDNRQAVVDSKATTRAKVEAERAAAPSQIAVIDAFLTILRGTFGNSADALADFGLAARKRPEPMTAEKKAVAVAKRAATREARGTRGRKEKKAIHGNVKAELVVTPSSSGAPPTRA